MNNLFFNNKSALNDFDLAIVNSIEYPFIDEDIETINIEGRKEGSVNIKTGNYKDIVIPVTFRLIKMDSYRNRIRKINLWLSNFNNNILFFSDYREKYYKVKKVEKTIISDSNFNSATFTVNFVCNPFVYKNNERDIVVTNGMKIFYDGDKESDPEIILTLPPASSNISIMINDREIQFREVSNSLTIISGKKIVFGSNGQSLTKKMIGKFPYLDLGENKITWNGIINKFVLNKNTIYRG